MNNDMRNLSLFIHFMKHFFLVEYLLREIFFGAKMAL